MQFLIMTLLDVLGNIAWVRYDFLSQGKISDNLIRYARMNIPAWCLKQPEILFSLALKQKV